MQNKQSIINKIKKEHKTVPILTEKELQRQYEIQTDFLKLIYNLDEKGQEGAFELRPIKRSKGDKTYIKSKHFWNLSTEKDEEYLKKYLEDLNGHGFCSYYSTFSFDYEMQIEKSRETTVNMDLEEKVKITYYKKGTINNTNALYTQILPLDLDGITYEDYEKYKNIFTELGIETLDVWSGHGVQMIILLDDKLWNKKIYQHWTNLLLSKGIPVDSKIVDPARVLRIPASFNCKALDSYKNKDGHVKLKFPELNGIIRNVFLLSRTEKRYNYLDVFGKIRSLPDVISDEDISQLEQEEQKARQRTLLSQTQVNKTTKKEVLSKDRTPQEITQEELQELIQDYPMLPIEELPLAIQNMLQGAPQGLRSRSVLFLAPFLQNYFKLDKKIIIEVVQIFANKCTPATRYFTEADIVRFLAHKPKYTSDLCNKFGWIDFQKIVVKNQDKMKISRQFFYYYNQISDGATDLYLKLKLCQEDTKQIAFTIKDVEEILSINRRTFYRYAQELIDLNFLIKNKTNKKNEETYEYALNLFKQASFITINKSTLELLFTKANKAETKLYTYLIFITHGEHKKECVTPQASIAAKTNKAQSSITRLTNTLQQKGFIEKITTKKGIQISTIYKLLR